VRAQQAHDIAALQSPNAMDARNFADPPQLLRVCAAFGVDARIGFGAVPLEAHRIGGEF
jgi:hypothetical protein